MSNIKTLREELELLGSMIGAERATPTPENRQCTDEQIERCHKLRDRLQAQQSNAEPVAWAYFGDFPDGKRLISADNTNLWGSDGTPLYTHPPASTEPRLTVEQAWPYLQHKKGCNMLSFTNSMMSHAPISQRLCDCGLDELRSSLTKAAKP